MEYLKAIYISLGLIIGIAYAQSGWVWQNPLPQGNTLSDVDFSDANTGTAVG